MADERTPSIGEDNTVDDWCTTQLPENVVFTYAWSVEGFRRELLSSCGKFLKSNDFTVRVENRNTRWQLVMYPNGDAEDNKTNVSLLIKYLGSDGGPSRLETILAVIEFSILDGNGRKTHVQDFEHNFTEDSYDTPGYSRFISHYDLVSGGQNLTPDHKFTVQCRLKIRCDDRINSPLRQTPIRFHFDGKVLSRDIGKLLRDTKSCDMTLQSADGQIIHCHSLILTARSTVFAAMLSHNMIESQEKTVRIEDSSATTIKEMLHYIYYGEIDQADDYRALLIAAEKYNLMELKDFCQNQLIQDININNCLELLVLSELHSASDLKHSVIYFIRKRRQDFIAIEGWEKILEPHPNLVCQVLRHVAT